MDQEPEGERRQGPVTVYQPSAISGAIAATNATMQTTFASVPETRRRGRDASAVPDAATTGGALEALVASLATTSTGNDGPPGAPIGKAEVEPGDLPAAPEQSGPRC